MGQRIERFEGWLQMAGRIWRVLGQRVAGGKDSEIYPESGDPPRAGPVQGRADRLAQETPDRIRRALRVGRRFSAWRAPEEPRNDRGREGRLSSRSPLPPNRTGGSPASGSPVGGFTSERIDGPDHGRGCRRTAHAQQRRYSASDDGPDPDPVLVSLGGGAGCFEGASGPIRRGAQ